LSTYLSEIETAILRSNETPIELDEIDELTVLGQRGIWANKSEVLNWKGQLPIESYLINEDSEPEIITKRVKRHLEYVQELAIRYLKPPTPPAPGEIVIKQEANTLTPPAPPLVIRQQPPRPDTPEPLIIREAPPVPPPCIGRKLITISGKKLPPPPRKVVIERMAPLPAKPQSVLIERWLPYNDNLKRRVVFQRASNPDPVVVKPRNVIVQWEAPSVSVKKENKFLGIVRANPVEYVQRYGTTLKPANELPQYVLDIKAPDGIVLASNYKYRTIYELEGDIEALSLVDLDQEGLAEYKAYLTKRRNSITSLASTNDSERRRSISTVSNSVESVIEEIFKSIDVKNTGSIDVDEAARILLRLNNRLGYGESGIKALFNTLGQNADNNKNITLDEFKQAFINLQL